MGDERYRYLLVGYRLRPGEPIPEPVRDADEAWAIAAKAGLTMPATEGAIWEIGTLD